MASATSMVTATFKGRDSHVVHMRRSHRPHRPLCSRPGSLDRVVVAAKVAMWNQRSTKTPRRVVFVSCSSSSGGSTGDGGEADLSGTCGALSRSFLQACLPQLNVPYSTALTSFVSSALRAYKSGASPAALGLQWQMSPGTGDAQLDEFMSQRGGLAADEAELRASWLSICYLAFSEAAVLRDETPVAGDMGVDTSRLGIFVKNVTELARQGNDLGRVKLREVFALSELSPAKSELESAVLSQGIRLVFLCLQACGVTTLDGAPITADSIGGPARGASAPASSTTAASVEGDATAAASRGSDDAERSARFRARREAEAAAATTSEPQAEDPKQAAQQEKGPEPKGGGEASEGTGDVLDEAAVRGELEKLRARELKERLTSLGVDASNCFDKEGLVERLTAVMLQQAKAPPQTSGVAVPLKWFEAPTGGGMSMTVGEYVGMQITLMGSTLTMIIDTAASANIITQATASRLQAPKTGRTTSAYGATGRIENMYEHALGEAQLYGIDLRGAAVTAFAMPVGIPIGDGLIGLWFLNAFDAVEFRWDERPGEAIFHPKGSVSWDKLTEGLTTVPLRPLGPDGLLCMDISVGGGASVPALVDTGAPTTIANPAAGVSIKTAGEMYVMGADGQPTPLKVSAEEHTIAAAGSKLAQLKLWVGDLPAFARLQLGPQQPGLILGIDALAQRPRVVFSSSERKIAF